MPAKEQRKVSEQRLTILQQLLFRQWATLHKKEFCVVLQIRDHLADRQNEKDLFNPAERRFSVIKIKDLHKILIRSQSVGNTSL